MSTPDNQTKGPGLRGRLWPVSLRRLKAHHVPYTELLKMPFQIWISSIVINLLGIGLPLLILQVYDRIIPNQSFNTLTLLVLGFVGVLVLEFLLRIGRAYSLGWAATQFEIVAGGKAVNQLLNAPLETISEDSTQTQLDRLTSVFRLVDFYGGPNSLLIIDLPFVLILIVTMALIAGWLVLVPIGILMVFAVLTLQFGRRLRQCFEEREDQDNKTYDFVAECLRGVITLKGLSMEPFMFRRFERLQKSRAVTNYSTIQASSTAQSISAILGNVTIIGTVSIGAMYAIAGDLSIGTLAACTLLAGRIIQPVVRFAGLWSEFQKLELALQEASELFSLPQKTGEAVVDHSDVAPVIEIKDLSIRKNEKTICGPFSLSIGEGECLGITGPDSLAKGEFLKALSGLSEIDDGEVLYNNNDVAHYRNGNPGSVVMVGPKSELFDGTILENISLFGTGPTIEEVRWAAGMTGIETDINRLPLGYDTPVGDGVTEKLTQGLVRRIVLTRAIAMLPKVLILEEPQTSLDRLSDQKLVRCLGVLRSKVTIVLSTMRPSYFQLADRMLTFENGEIYVQSNLESAAMGNEGPRKVGATGVSLND